MKQDKYLAWLLGPKSENFKIFEEILNMIFQDYIHWRRNYFPGDSILIDKKMQRDFEVYYDTFRQKVLEMTAELRRNFPFFNPRYIAHMQSETTMPSILGFFAGNLYNPNNVTPEGSPVTIHWEIEVIDKILEMLGYAPPPKPCSKKKEYKNYYACLKKKEYGWGHITGGGTIANIEALWVARNVKYTSLSIKEVAINKNLNIKVKSPDGKKYDIRQINDKVLLSIKPNESIYLLMKYYKEIRKKDIKIDPWQLLNSSENSISKGMRGEVFRKYPPVIFVSGAAHYSISKAADLLGIGRDNVKKIKMDKLFRLDVNDLRDQIIQCYNKNFIPLAVVGIAGTTEEGAVDPIHEIQELREQLETENLSFWLHIDAAWGGYIRSLFCWDRNFESLHLLSNISKRLGLGKVEDLNLWNERFQQMLVKNQKMYKAIDKYAREQYRLNCKMFLSITDRYSFISLSCIYFEIIKMNIQITVTQNTCKEKYMFQNKIISLPEKYKKRIYKLDYALSNQEVADYVKIITKIISDYKIFFGVIRKKDLKLNLNSRVNIVTDFVKDKLIIDLPNYKKEIEINWSSDDVCKAFLMLPCADSITIDPHKLGYIPYPCGVIAFKNDRIRQFIMQKTPYLSSVEDIKLDHTPPKHLDLTSNGHNDGQKIITESFGKFTLEGSRPGASATALWLSTKIIPLDKNGHGLLIRSSLLAAREFYEWLIRWNKILTIKEKNLDIEFVSLTDKPPDTNIINFVIKKKSSNSLEELNELTSGIYNHFTIQNELGDNEFSYSQPFFLSKTKFSSEIYQLRTLQDFFKRSKIRNSEKSYAKEGLFILRATIMNPYIHPMRKNNVQEYLLEFFNKITTAAEKVLYRMNLIRTNL